MAEGGAPGAPGLHGPWEDSSWSQGRNCWGSDSRYWGQNCVEGRPDPLVRVGEKCFSGRAKGASPCLPPLLAAST